MGKKDKRVDKAKVEAKKERKASKQEKLEKKRAVKESKGADKEQDIESILAEFAAKEKLRTAVTITLCAGPPSPRAQFSISSASSSSNDLILFGGEFFDGECTTVFNDVYRWNLDKNEWRLIESLNTPPPRCSHQAVYYKDRVYIFGGEYATLDQFYHYRDMWYLDVKTNIWKEVKPQGDVPSARSGHRMVVWRNYIVLFGGFYEAMRDVKWFNDLYVFSFQEERWTQIPYKPHAQVPKPRSGHQMVLYAAEDSVFVYGGYSKEKQPGVKAEGKVHDDMWMLNLKALIPAGAAAKGSIDVTKLTWQKVSKKGAYPTPRSGAAMAVYKNKAILFGGVFDVEGPRHSLISTFYNDMFAFDMERKRWYQLGLKAAQGKKAEKKASAETGGEDEAADEETAAGDEDGDDEDVEKKAANLDYDTGKYFGFIDETGNVVYVDLEAEEETENELSASEPVPDTSTSLPPMPDPSPAEDHVDGIAKATIQDLPQAPMKASDSSQLSPLKPSPASISKPTAIYGAGALSSAFEGRIDPHPRISPCLVLKGNSLLVYGGLAEIGDVEVTLDDCWSLDLNRRDHWKQLLQGTMHALVWKGEALDDETEGTRSETEDGDSDDEDEDSDDDASNSDDEPAARVSRGGDGKASGKVSGVKQEMERLREELGDGQDVPAKGESLREFYSRTTDFWSQRVITAWKEREAAGLAGYEMEVLTEKAIKREGFVMAETRYGQLLPILSRLDELDEQQQLQEEELQAHSGAHKKSSRR